MLDHSLCVYIRACIWLSSLFFVIFRIESFRELPLNSFSFISVIISMRSNWWFSEYYKWAQHKCLWHNNDTFEIHTHSCLRLLAGFMPPYCRFRNKKNREYHIHIDVSQNEYWFHFKLVLIIITKNAHTRAWERERINREERKTGAIGENKTKWRRENETKNGHENWISIDRSI